MIPKPDITPASPLVRSFDYQFIESVITHPSVIKGARWKDGLTIQPVVENLNNYLLVNEFGGFIVVNQLPTVYECHTQFLPEGRGPQVRDAVKDAFDYMFINTDCERITTRAYKDNFASVKLSREFFTEEGETNEYFYYSLRYENWVKTDLNLSAGQEFHELVKETTNHGDDKTHDYHVGAAVRMAKAGNYGKAQHLFNSWALMSGYEPLVILKTNPLLVQAGDLRFEIGEEVRICQQP